MTNRDSRSGSVTKLTSSGALVGNFDPDDDIGFPQGISIDTAGNAWVANTARSTVIKLNSAGGLIGAFDPPGSKLDEPADVAIDAAANVWATNIEGNTVTKLTSSGAAGRQL